VNFGLMLKFIIFVEIDSGEIDFVALILNESAFSDAGSMNGDSCWMNVDRLEIIVHQNR